MRNWRIQGEWTAARKVVLETGTVTGDQQTVWGWFSITLPFFGSLWPILDRVWPVFSHLRLWEWNEGSLRGTIFVWFSSQPEDLETNCKDLDLFLCAFISATFGINQKFCLILLLSYFQIYSVFSSDEENWVLPSSISQSLPPFYKKSNTNPSDCKFSQLSGFGQTQMQQLSYYQETTGNNECGLSQGNCCFALSEK